MNRRQHTRRGFLRSALHAAGGAASLRTAGALFGGLAAHSARAEFSDYKALVCVFLHGGNDGFNWLIPNDDAGYASYQQPRRNIAIPRNQLLGIDPPGMAPLGLHPSCPNIRSLFAQGDAAFIANCGVLMAPTTKANYALGRNLPPALFSHNDQQDHWMTARPGQQKLTGWAGRVHTQLESSLAATPLAMNLSLAGNNLLQSGGPIPAYILAADGAALINDIHFTSANYYPYMSGIAAGELSPNALERSLAGAMRNAFEVGEYVDGALDATPAPSAGFDENVELGRNLRMAAHLIEANRVLGVNRQIFFIGHSGFDTHDSQATRQAQLLGELDAAVNAFQVEMASKGLANDVTLFTMSEFGRTLTVNGDGSDHGWGSHHLVVGGAVNGGTVYGTLPDLTIDGPDDTGYGRIIPTTSMDQYAATLANWFGVPRTQLATVFPNIGRFAPRTLGFLG